MAGIYVHIPFCRSKCAYCDFYSGPFHGNEDDFVSALAEEWRQRYDELDGQKVDTVYLGGGTPSSLPARLLDRILDLFPLSCVTELTMEANPEDIGHEMARWLAASPVNRVSLGLQSLDDTELAAVGRRHTAREAMEAVETLRHAGITNISLDLIYGLPGQDSESWHRSLSRVIGARPEHLSCYLLSYERGTRLWAMLQAGKVAEATEETVVRMYDMLIEETSRAGYRHYEISNFALPGMHSRHNSAYWDGTPYLGLGPGAHSLTLGCRRHNPPDIKGYITRLGRDVTITEHETEAERFNDLIITALRTSRGLNPDDCLKRRDSLLATAGPHIAAGRMEWTPAGHLRVAEKSWLLTDAILLDLIDA